tara:strand:+ start:88 stop:207 length:120 start_codon:yes stop_codon:yes gene_type:complete
MLVIQLNYFAGIRKLLMLENKLEKLKEGNSIFRGIKRED